LREYKTPEVIERLRQVMTDDSHAFVRRPAMIAYWRATGKAAVPMLLMGLMDDDEWVREDAATMLGKSGDPSAIPALQAAASDPNPETAAAVRDALTALQAVKR
jgi:HEAT repeat protein